jgi:uncharacterized repeat protein (TIGR01451 family)
VFDYTSDLGVFVSATTNPVPVGSNLVYSITVVNYGPYTAANVSLTNTLPPGVLLKSASTTSGTLVTNANPITGNLGNLLQYGSAFITLTTAPQTPGLIIDSAQVSSDFSDPGLTNNSATYTNYVLPLPLVSIRTLAGNRVRVSWPVALTNYGLQYTPALTTLSAWSNVTSQPGISGSESFITESNSSPARFYRLLK